MLTHREFSAWIMSEGEPLREHLVAVDTNANKVSCWIPSETGKTFSVHWRDEGTRIHSCSFISLDGFLVPGRFLCGHGEASREGVRTGPNTQRPFMFAEQSNILTPGEQPNPNAGTIMLKIRCISIDGSRSANRLQQLPEPSGAQGNMLSHCIRYGEESFTYEQFPETWNVKSYDGSGNRSYVTFVFRYRSREFLTSQGIIPMDSALQIPPAVRNACAMNRRVVSAPLPMGSSTSMTQNPAPSAHMKDNSERMGSALQNAFSPGSIPVRQVTNVRTVSAQASSGRNHYPGEGVLDLGPTTNPNILWHDPNWANKGMDHGGL